MKETIELKRTTVLNAYNTGSKDEKKFIEKFVGIKELGINIMDQLDTFEDACRIKGVYPADIIPFPNPKNDFQEGTNAFCMLTLISDVLWEDEVPDYDNGDQEKWEPRFVKLKGGGFGFSGTYFGHWRTYTDAGSRLNYPTEKKAKFAATKFSAIYNVYLTKLKPYQF